MNPFLMSVEPIARHASPDEAIELLRMTRDSGFKMRGLSFQVGSR